MSRLRDLHEKWLEDPAYREEYERLGPEFELARALIEARAGAGLTQAELALRMGTTQSVIARLEFGPRPADHRNLAAPCARYRHPPQDRLRARRRRELTMAVTLVVGTEVRPPRSGC